MRIRIVQITDRGVPNKERLHLVALAPLNLVNYVIFDSWRSPDDKGVIPIPKRAYWFTSKVAAAGDNIVLYTGSGVPSENRRSDGGTNHFFYWGVNTTLWGDPRSIAVVLEVNDWISGV